MTAQSVSPVCILSQCNSYPTLWRSPWKGHLVSGSDTELYSCYDRCHLHYSYNTCFTDCSKPELFNSVLNILLRYTPIAYGSAFWKLVCSFRNLWISSNRGTLHRSLQKPNYRRTIKHQLQGYEKLDCNVNYLFLEVSTWFQHCLCSKHFGYHTRRLFLGIDAEYKFYHAYLQPLLCKNHTAVFIVHGREDLSSKWSWYCNGNSHLYSSYIHCHV